MLSMSVCFDFRSTNVVQLSNRNPSFYRFWCHHPLISCLAQMTSLKNSPCALHCFAVHFTISPSLVRSQSGIQYCLYLLWKWSISWQFVVRIPNISVFVQRINGTYIFCFKKLLWSAVRKQNTYTKSRLNYPSKENLMANLMILTNQLS